MMKYEFSNLYRETCFKWWEIWQKAAEIEDIDKRNAFLDAERDKFMYGTDYAHKALLMHDLIEVAKSTLEYHQYPAFGRKEYEQPFRI